MALTAGQTGHLADHQEGVYTVVHGTTAGTARPTLGSSSTAPTVVLWIGTVEPTNAVDNDLWMDTTSATPNSKVKVSGSFITAGRGTFAQVTPEAISPLNIPTYDDDPSVGHPDVLYIADGFNGYRYWMAFTPYPDESRENPSILASNDGVNWVEPSGISNPIVPLSETQAAGYEYGSDTDLILLPNGDLAVYYRLVNTSTGDEVVFRKTSSDGVTWSSSTEVLVGAYTGTSQEALSPALVVEDDDTFTMWAVERAGSTYTLERRTSADGVTFAAPTDCTLPTGVSPWHVDVVRVGDLYHALVVTTSYRLVYLTSEDGSTWAGSTVPLAKTGHAFDAHAHYRSTLVPKPGGTFDIYLTGVAEGGTPNAIFSAEWRIGLLRDVPLGRFLPADGTSEPLRLGASGVTKAGETNTGTGTNHTAVGSHTGDGATGNEQTLIGYYAGYQSSGLNHTAVGAQAGRSNTGAYSTHLGHGAGYQNGAASCTGVGYQAVRDNTGVSVVGVGREAGAFNTGSDSTFVGQGAGKNNTGTGVVFIGKDAGASNAANQRLIIHNSSDLTSPLIDGYFSGVSKGIKVNGVVATASGATGSRPSAADAGVGGMWFDTTLGHPIWSTGTVWVDATGTTV